MTQPSREQLLAELREKARWRPNDIHGDLHNAAADEIERLRSNAQALPQETPEQRLDSDMTLFNNARAEMAKTILPTFVDMIELASSVSPYTLSRNASQKRIERAKAIALAALSITDSLPASSGEVRADQIETAAQAMYEFEPWEDGTTWRTMPEAGKNAFRENMRFVFEALKSSPSVAVQPVGGRAIDDVPSCGSENDHRRAASTNCALAGGQTMDEAAADNFGLTADDLGEDEE